MREEVAARYWDCERPEMLAFVPASARRVLDIGCANGRFSALVKQRQGAETWGIERNPEAAREAATRLHRVINEDVYAALGRLPEKYFDCVVCNDVLEHLRDPSRVLRELRRNLAPGGVIVASIPNLRYLPVLYELLVRRDFRYRDAGVLDRTHLRFFTKKSIRRLFEAEGFILERIRGLQAPVPPVYRLAFLFTTLATLGWYNDTRFIQYACVARQGLKE